MRWFILTACRGQHDLQNITQRTSNLRTTNDGRHYEISPDVGVGDDGSRPADITQMSGVGAVYGTGRHEVCPYNLFLPVKICVAYTVN